MNRSSGARSLKRAPWVLFGVAVGTMAARDLLGDGLPFWAILAIVAASAVLIVLGAKFYTHRAAQALLDPDVDYAGSSLTLLRSLRGVPGLAGPLKRVRLTFLVGGFLLGRLLVGRNGIAFLPNLLTRHVLGVPSVQLSWEEIETAEVHEQFGLFENGVLDLRLRDGGTCAFSIYRRQELATLLETLR